MSVVCSVGATMSRDGLQRKSFFSFMAVTEKD